MLLYALKIQYVIKDLITMDYLRGKTMCKCMSDGILSFLQVKTCATPVKMIPLSENRYKYSLFEYSLEMGLARSDINRGAL